MIPKRTDFQLAWEARQFQEHMIKVADHSKCSMASPCKQPVVRKVSNSLQRQP